jgi:hypothetical protein
MALSHKTLRSYYSMIFSMAQHHKYSISDLENLMPYELDIYVGMLLQYIEETKKQ